MEELAHDLASALEESEQLKPEVEEESPVEEDLSRKRRIRKRRPTCPVTSHNSLSVCTADSTTYRGQNSTLASGSDTENGFVLPATIRKHRRKKIKHMEVDFRNNIKCPKMQEKRSMEFEVEEQLSDCKAKAEEESGISASDDSADDDVDGQDGDDEMTDFYSEPGGSVCGIPSIIPWWEEGCDEDFKLKSIISTTLPFLSEAGQRGFHARVNRLPGMAARSIRRSRRRHKIKKSEKSSASLPELRIYKRRKTDNTLEDVEISSLHLPIPDTNAGHKILVSMGWKPGEGLGLHGQGIQSPIFATKRNKRSGIGL